MPFLSVTLRDFRNLENATISTGSSQVFLIGENGQGKSNFLEAVYLLAYGSSFRAKADGDIPRRGGSSYCVIGRKENEETGSSDERVEISWRSGKKTISINNKTVNDRKELLFGNPIILFSHNDIAFASGEPERKRFFFDQTISLLFPSYIDTIRNYRRVLRTRNHVLRLRNFSVLDVLDNQLIAFGLEMVGYRERAVKAFSEVFTEVFETVSHFEKPIQIRYKPNWPLDLSSNDLQNRILTKRNEEIALGTSLSGPHRDRFVFLDGIRDFTHDASTGQLRLTALALRSAQARYVAKETKRSPILLLDDVLLELDPERRKRFLAALPKHEQAFFTFLPGEPYSSYSRGEAIVLEVSNGRFSH